MGAWCAHAIASVWRTESNVRELALSFHHGGPRDHTQVLTLASKLPLPTEPSLQSQFIGS